ncbi:MAG TPA: hypothetical protein VFY67_10950 [Pyrinomonadaceae bacterium]|nr:hypothetical protein [Pyrinomonadaceae bacterium]
MTPRHFTCPSCSKEISIDSAVCPSCGARMDDEATRRFDVRKTPTQSYDYRWK